MAGTEGYDRDEMENQIIVPINIKIHNISSMRNLRSVRFAGSLSGLGSDEYVSSIYYRIR
jgi:hypothetical protein